MLGRSSTRTPAYFAWGAASNCSRRAPELTQGRRLTSNPLCVRAPRAVSHRDATCGGVCRAQGLSSRTALADRWAASARVHTVIAAVGVSPSSGLRAQNRPRGLPAPRARTAHLRLVVAYRPVDRRQPGPRTVRGTPG